MITNISMLSIMLMRNIEDSIFDKTKTWLECNTVFDKELTPEQKELEKKEEHINLLRGAKLENEITRAAAKFEAINPAQIVRLLERDFQFDSDLERFVFLKRDAKGKLQDEKNVEERVEEYLTDESNDNLVKTTINTAGTGTSQSEASTTTTKSAQKQTDGYDPKDEALIKEADFKRLSVEDLIETKKLRDAKFAAIEETQIYKEFPYLADLEWEWAYGPGVEWGTSVFSLKM